MTDLLIDILEANTPLVLDKDLFYLEMPLDKSGLWFADRPTDSIFNGVDYKEYDIYYRSKNKNLAIKNIKVFKELIDSLDVCRIGDISFKLSILSQWDYLEKDSEGYFVFANAIRLTV